MSRILVIEDDRDISKLVHIHLSDLNYKVEQVYDGNEGLVKALSGEFDLIILDLMLPGMDGVTICQKLRAEDNDTMVLMLTAKSEEIDKVLGLETGADDYLTKPFSVRELIARVKALLRRVKSNNELGNDELQEIIRGSLKINIPKRQVHVQESDVELTPKEFDLLVYLASNPGITFSRVDLLSKVWGYEFAGYEHTVNSHINRLRNKIETDMNNPEFILTTWGVGYKFADL